MISKTIFVLFLILILAQFYASIVSGNKADFMKVGLGESCASDGDCDTINMTCSSGVCKCKEEYIEVRQKCLKKAIEIFDICEHTDQCTPNLGVYAICINNEICGCDLEKSVESSDFKECIRLAETLGDSCTTDTECQLSAPGMLSECRRNSSEPDTDKGKCTCSSGTINAPGQNTCLQIASKLADSCDHDIQCQNFGDLSECHNRECSCKINTGIPNGNRDRCLEVVNRLGGSCSETVQCQAGEPGQHSECHSSSSSRTCQCRKGSANVEGKYKCLTLATKLGDECEDNLQCRHLIGEQTDNSSCVKYKCGCTENIGIPNKDESKCLPIVNRINGKCQEDQQCQMGNPGNLSVCFMNSLKVGVCACNQDCVPNAEHKCLLAAKSFEDDCEDDIQCSENLGLSRCDTEREKCFCIQDESVLNTEKSKCLRISFFGEPCEDNLQCLAGGKNTECVKRGCTCNNESMEIRRECWRRTVLGSICENTEECTKFISGGAVCDLGLMLCQCSEGKKPEFEGIFCADCATTASAKYKFTMFIINVIMIGFTNTY